MSEVLELDTTVEQAMAAHRKREANETWRRIQESLSAYRRYRERIFHFCESVFENMQKAVPEPAALWLSGDIYDDLLPQKEGSKPQEGMALAKMWGLPIVRLTSEFRGCYQIRCIDGSIYTYGASVYVGQGEREKFELSEVQRGIRDLLESMPVEIEGAR